MNVHDLTILTHVTQSAMPGAATSGNDIISYISLKSKTLRHHERSKLLIYVSNPTIPTLQL